jgi:hypothetical protein
MNIMMVNVERKMCQQQWADAANEATSREYVQTPLLEHAAVMFTQHCSCVVKMTRHESADAGWLVQDEAE